MPHRAQLRRAAAARLRSRNQTRGGGRGGCSSAEWSFSINLAGVGDAAGGEARAIAATAFAGRTEHFRAQEAESPQPFLVCFSQCPDWGQQSAWAVKSDMPAAIDERISAAETGKTASDKATAATIMARRDSISCPNIRSTGVRSSELTVRLGVRLWRRVQRVAATLLAH